MYKIISVFVIICFTSLLWGMNPKIVTPREGTEIKNNSIFIFVEPTPTDIEERRHLYFEIHHRDTGIVMIKNTLSPDKNYQSSINISTWENGSYLLKVVFKDKKGASLTRASWRNFTVQR